MLKTIPESDAEKNAFFYIFSGFWMDVLAMPGGKGGADTWLYRMILIIWHARHPSGVRRMKMGSKIHAKSMKRVPKRTKAVIRLGHHLATIFGQKSKKTKKKMNTVIGHCPGALQECKKNNFWEARKTSCFLDGFFIENGSLFEAIFNEKTFQKSMLILNPKKSWFLMENQCKHCLSFFIFLLFFWFVFEKCLMQNTV